MPSGREQLFLGEPVGVDPVACLQDRRGQDDGSRVVAERRPRLRDHRPVQDELRPAAAHVVELEVGRAGTVLVIVRAAAHGEQVLERHPSLAVVEVVDALHVGKEGQHLLIDALDPALCDSDADQRRGEALADRLQLVQLVRVVVAEVLLQHQPAVAHDQQAVDVADLATLADGRDQLSDPRGVEPLLRQAGSAATALPAGAPFPPRRSGRPKATIR